MKFGVAREFVSHNNTSYLDFQFSVNQSNQQQQQKPDIQVFLDKKCGENAL